jgi:hypothetical protein
MRSTIFLGLALCLLWPASKNALSQDGFVIPAFQVRFTNCVESIGVGLAPTDGVLETLPPEFTPVGIGEPVTPVVVRTSRCAISVQGFKKRTGNIVQIGAIIIPPDGTGDINNYTLYYYTDDIVMWLYLNVVGVDAQYVPTLQYRMSANNSLLVRIPVPGFPRFQIAGNIAPSNVSSGSFLANWWQKSPCGIVKMSTNVPVIKIGGADLTLTTQSDSSLGQLIGDDTLNFPIIQQFNSFDEARMKVELVVP